MLANDLPGSATSLSVTQVSAVSPSTAGTVTKNADNTLSYTPAAVVDATFTYTISGGAGLLPSTATVSIRGSSGAVTIEQVCLDRICTFTAKPADAANVKRYLWSFYDRNPPRQVEAQDRYTYEFANEGRYRVTVQVDYYSGKSVIAAIDCDVVLSKHASWDPVVPDGLGVAINNIRGLNTFPAGTNVYINWSRNYDDCDHYYETTAGACGDGAFLSFGECGYNASCRVTGGQYRHTGNYTATLRFAVPPSTVVADYSIPITVTNKKPVVKFDSTRLDPNKRKISFGRSFEDDGPFPLQDAIWDFGDGTIYPEPSGPLYEPINHTYKTPGTYTVALQVTDADGQTGTVTNPVVVTNSAPVPGIRVNCKVLDCTFGIEPTIDDGEIATWKWNFGDGTSAGPGGEQSKHFNAAGCYDVSVVATDVDGANGVGHVLVPVGPQIAAPAPGVVVDAHTQSSYYAQKWLTTNGDLNGIVEPGELVTVEPYWASTPAPQSDLIGWRLLEMTSQQYANPEIRGSVLFYDLSKGVSDCWTAGGCYALSVQTLLPGLKPTAHADVSFEEFYPTTGASTPGGRIRIHVGKSFDDVPKTHWAYPAIESVFHTGIAAACSAPFATQQFCPTKQLTRGEIARWLMVAEHGSTYAPPACTGSGPFLDVPCSDPNAAWIAQLKAEGLTTGTGGGNYSPAATLTRAELAVFLVRTKFGASYAPRPCQNYFTDVPCGTHWAAPWISDLKTRTFTTGCSAYEFCPSDPVDRAQAARLFTTTFGVSIDKRQCAPALGYEVVPTHPVTPPIASIAFNPSPLLSGSSGTGTIVFGIAPPQDVDVPITVSPAAVSMPSSVRLGAGKTSISFPVTASNVSARTATFVTASYAGDQKTVQLDVCVPAPTISVQPANVTINANQTATLSVTASGAGTLSYQWYQGTTPVGTNSSSFTTPTLSATTSYSVVVSNECGGTPSNTVIVTVCTPPRITTHPVADVVAYGKSTTLSVGVTGTGPFEYQWYENDVAVPTATSATYSPTLTATKTYWVRVTCKCNGSIPLSSNAATVTVVSQITQRQQAAGTAQSLTSVTANWPRATQQGSLLVAAVSASNSSYPVATFTAPAGWQLAQSYEWNNIKTAIYYYANNPGNLSAATFTVNTFRDVVLQMVEYVAIGAAAPLDRSAFAGDNAPVSAVVSSGTTPVTLQAKELVFTALTSYSRASFSTPTNGFVELDERSAGNFLTTAIHHRIVTSSGAYGHSATVSNNAQWVGVVATFKSADTSALNFLTPAQWWVDRSRPDPEPKPVQVAER